MEPLQSCRTWLSWLGGITTDLSLHKGKAHHMLLWNTIATPTLRKTIMGQPLPCPPWERQSWDNHCHAHLEKGNHGTTIATPTLRKVVMLPTEYTCISSMAPELALLTTGERWQLKERGRGRREMPLSVQVLWFLTSFLLWPPPSLLPGTRHTSEWHQSSWGPEEQGSRRAVAKRVVSLIPRPCRRRDCGLGMRLGCGLSKHNHMYFIQSQPDGRFTRLLSSSRRNNEICPQWYQD